MHRFYCRMVHSTTTIHGRPRSSSSTLLLLVVVALRKLLLLQRNRLVIIIRRRRCCCSLSFSSSFLSSETISVFVGIVKNIVKDITRYYSTTLRFNDRPPTLALFLNRRRRYRRSYYATSDDMGLCVFLYQITFVLVLFAYCSCISPPFHTKVSYLVPIDLKMFVFVNFVISQCMLMSNFPSLTAFNVKLVLRNTYDRRSSKQCDRILMGVDAADDSV